MAEWVVNGFIATISGVLTVFTVLIIIALVIDSLKYLIHPKKTIEQFKSKRKNKKRSLESVEDIVVEELVEEEVINRSLEEELELVAVITAAIAASLEVSQDKLVVRSIRRINDTSAWHRRRVSR